MDYQIKPVAVEGFADADGVCENRDGAWLGQVEGEEDRQVVQPYADEGDYIPAPANWRKLIVKAL
jgi:hypothetical protein